jgi:hypothetical protein
MTKTLVNDIPAGDGKIADLFLQGTILLPGAGLHPGGAGCHLPHHLLHPPPRQRLLPPEAAQAR